MKKFKNAIFVFMAIVAACFALSLTACGDDKDDEPENNVDKLTLYKQWEQTNFGIMDGPFGPGDNTGAAIEFTKDGKEKRYYKKTDGKWHYTGESKIIIKSMEESETTIKGVYVYANDDGQPLEQDYEFTLTVENLSIHPKGAPMDYTYKATSGIKAE